jgi:Amt family ammonium transporter
VTIVPGAGGFPQGGKPRKIQGSNLPMAVFEVFLIWMSWFGLNGGSTLAMDAQLLNG